MFCESGTAGLGVVSSSALSVGDTSRIPSSFVIGTDCSDIPGTTSPRYATVVESVSAARALSAICLIESAVSDFSTIRKWPLSTVSPPCWSASFSASSTSLAADGTLA